VCFMFFVVSDVEIAGMLPVVAYLNLRLIEIRLIHILN